VGKPVSEAQPHDNIADLRTAGLAPTSYFSNSRSVTLSLTTSSKRRRQPFWRQAMERTVDEIPLISVVDDDDAVRAATAGLVRSLGFEARTFASAESFLQSSFLSETRCLVLDVQMPNTSGVELQNRLSQLGIDIPIIFITAYPDEALKDHVLEAGAVAFLHKPFDVHGQRFVDCLYAALKRHKGPAP
jgi:CheY-like chemotaxis protein